MRELISTYQELTRKITAHRETIETIYLAAASPGIKNVTDMPMAPGFSGGGLEDTFIQIEELEDRIKEYKRERWRIAERIEAQLDLAGVSSVDRVVFWLREVHGMKWNEVAAETGKSVRQLQRISQKPIYMSLLL